MFDCSKKSFSKYFDKDEAMEKINELFAQSKLNELLHKKEEKKTNGVVIALAIVGAIAAVAGIAFVVYKLMKPEYLEEFDDFDDLEDIDEDEEEEEQDD